MNATNRVMLSVWISEADSEAIDELLGRYTRLSRHLAGVAALRAGIAALKEHPERVLELVEDHKAGQHVRLREEPK